jgi:hypothetical protein
MVSMKKILWKHNILECKVFLFCLLWSEGRSFQKKENASESIFSFSNKFFHHIVTEGSYAFVNTAFSQKVCLISSNILFLFRNCF